MKEKLGKFTLQERIDEGGDTVVYRAVEEMGQGISRPAAVKILQTMKMDDQERIESLKAEVGLLVEVSASPNVVTVFGFGIDEEEGPWIAMELLGDSLRHFIKNEPADPEQVRVLLRDTLRGLSVVHGSNPPILHRDLKPNNILSTRFSNWQIADFGLAKRANSEDTLQVMTVKYAAPEMLDGQLGEDSPRLDLYSLGMLVYEYALGTELHHQQFPSVYDPQGGGGGDDRPKWMYWHTSMQMTVPPLCEVLEDFPKDISDLVAAMTAKPLRERIDSADQALESLGQVEGAIVRSIEEQLAPDESKTRNKRNLILGGITAVVIILAAAALFIFQEVSSTTSVAFAREEAYIATAPTVQVTGTITNYPEGGSAQIRLMDNTTCPVFVDSDGSFTSDVRATRLGDATAAMYIYDELGYEVAKKILQLRRVPPKSVRVELATRPVISNASIVLTERDDLENPKNLTTDLNGAASVEVAYGGFDLEISHPRFKREKDFFETGIDPVVRLRYALKPLSEERLDGKRAGLLDELDGIAEQAADGEASAIEKLTGLRAELKNLAPSSSEQGAEQKIPLFEELDEVSGLAARGDQAAVERVHGLNEQFQRMISDDSPVAAAPAGVLPSGRRGLDPNSPEGRRAALLTEMDDLARRAAAGDRGAASGLADVQAQLAALSDQELAASPDLKRAALVRELEVLTERARLGDPEAIARLAEVQSELALLSAAEGTPVTNPRRAALVEEMQELAALAAAGDQSAVARIKEIQGELVEIDARERADGGRREALVRELDDQAARAAVGDPVAVDSIRGIQSELERIDERAARVNAGAARAGRRAALLAEMDDLADRAAAGDPEAIKRLQQVREELAQIEAEEADRVADPVADRRAGLVAELDGLAQRAADGDPAAVARIQEIQAELQGLSRGSASGNLVVSRAAERAPLLAEMDDLADRAGKGDPAAIARLKQVQQELARMDADEAVTSAPGIRASRQAALVQELDELTRRAAAGDPEAIARLREVRQELAALSSAELETSGGDPSTRRAALAREAEALADRVAAGDPAAIRRLSEIQSELAALEESERDSTAPAAGESRRASLVRELEEVISRDQTADTAAAARIETIQQELRQSEAFVRAAQAPDQGISRRAALLSELGDVAERAAAGDPAAIARMAEIREDLEQIGATAAAVRAPGLGESRRAALVAELGGLADRAATGDASAEDRLRAVPVELEQIATETVTGAVQQSEVAGRAALVSELKSLADRAAQGDPAAIARVKEIQQELVQLDQEERRGSVAVRRGALVQELADLEARAAAGDPAAIARMKEIQLELVALDQREQRDSVAGRRAELLKEMEDLTARAAAGDPAAIARLGEVRAELAQLEEEEQQESVATRRAALVQEMAGLEARAAAGDPAAVARLKEIQQELVQLDVEERAGSVAVRRAALVEEMADLEARAGLGDPAAIERLRQIQQELVQLDKEQRAESVASQRSALVQEMAELEAPTVAAARIETIQQELRQSEAFVRAAQAPAQGVSRRAALLSELGDVAELAAAGDPAAIARMAEIREDLEQIGATAATVRAPGLGESRRAALVAELGGLADRAATGDASADDRLRAVPVELEQIAAETVTGSAQQSEVAGRAALVSELKSLADRAAQGDPAAIARMKEIQQELVQLDQEERRGSVAVRRGALVQELADLEARAAAGDPAAIARMKEIQLELVALDQREQRDSVAGRRAELLKEMEDLTARAAAGDPAAIARLGEVRAELAQLEEEEQQESVATRRAALVQEMAGLEARAAAGDPAAVARLKEIQQELVQLDVEERAGSVAVRRAALVEEMADLEARAGLGDPAAIERLRQIQQELVQLDKEQRAESVASRRSALVQEMADLEARAAAGDPSAVARLKEIRSELVQLDEEQRAGSVAARREALVQELADLETRAAAGDPAAIARLSEIQQELAQLDEEERAGSVASRRAALVAELADLETRAAAGDPAAIARLKEIQEELTQLDEEQQAGSVATRRAGLVQELEDLQERAESGDPVALARMREIQQELQELAAEEAASSVAGRRVALVEEIGELVDRAAAGDEAAGERLEVVQQDLAKLEQEDAQNTELARRSALVMDLKELILRASGVSVEWKQAAAMASIRQVYESLKDLESNDTYNSVAARRAALIHEMEDLMVLAAAGDPEALARIQQIQKELAMLEGGSPGAFASAGSDLAQVAGQSPVARRAALIKELGGVAERAVAGDRGALGRAAQIQDELELIEAGDLGGSALARRRKSLVRELGVVTDLALARDVAALSRILGIQRELAALSLIESATGESLLANAQGLLLEEELSLDIIDRTTLLQLTPEEFRIFVQINVPVGTLEVETVPHLSKLRVMGPLFNEREMGLLRARLASAEPRIHYELKTDPWAVCHMIQTALEQRGARGVRVHAHLSNGDNGIYVQFQKTGRLSAENVRTIVSPFVIDQQLLLIQPYRETARGTR